MREYSFTHKFEKGLRAQPDEPRNSGALEQCHNLKVFAGHLTVPTTIEMLDRGSYVQGDEQLFCLQEGNYICGSDYIVTLDSALDLSTFMHSTTPTTPWSVADFGAYVVFTNGAIIYITNPTTGIVSAYTGSDIPRCRTICNFKGQLISGSPYGYDPNVVLWGDIGWANMSISDTVVAGYRPMPWNGYVYAVRRLGEYIAVYGQDGVALLAAVDTTPPGFGMRELSTLGLISAQAIDGSLHKHLYVRSDGMLCLLHVDPFQAKIFKQDELGYQSYLAGLSNVKVSFDAGLDEWYISSDTTNFIYTLGGLSTTNLYVDTCCSHRGKLYGIYSLSGSTSHYVQLCEADFGGRADKAIEYLEVAGDGVWTTTIDWRRTTTDSFVSSPTFPINPMGAGRAKVSGVDFKIKLTSASTTAQLDSMICRWKYQDKRFVRGLDARQAVA
jgi:hypothetical protein